MSFHTDRLSNILSNMEMNTSNLKTVMKSPSVTEILMKDTNNYEMEVKLLKEELRVLKENIHNRKEPVIKQVKGGVETKEQAQKILELTLEIEKLKQTIKIQNAAFDYFKKQTEDKIKSQLDEILQIKGAIRVVTRVKPFVSNEKVLLTDNTIEIPSKSLVSRCFRVLAPKSTQENLFSEIEDLIYSVTKGYKVSILAYGPTGSGKTYSMEGPSSNKVHTCANYFSTSHEHAVENVYWCEACKEEGIIYRSTRLLKSEIKRLEMLGYTNSIRVSAVELYNDKIINSIEKTPILDEIVDVFKAMSRNRKIGSTECNLRSSRSHLIFTIDLALQRSNAETGSVEYVKGSLCIGDLAGSERLNHSKAEGERMKEAVEINKSLTSLGDVVYAIANNTAHIPYRNSKLTTLLKDTLGPGSKTAFIINIDPGLSIEETVTALRFSNRLQECKLGRSKSALLEKY